MDRFSTKDTEDRFDEEADRLVRPSPRKKPPRHDKRRERVNVDTDPDLSERDPDMSLNYKDVGGSVTGMNGFPDPPVPPKPVKRPKPPKRVPLPKPPKLPPVPKPRPPAEEVSGEISRKDYDQSFWDEMAPYLTDLVRSDPNFFDYLKNRVEEKPKPKTTDLLGVRHDKVPEEIETYGHLREWVQMAGGLETLERSVPLPARKSIAKPSVLNKVSTEEIPQATEDPLPLVTDPPDRVIASYEDRRSSVQSLVAKLKPAVAVRYASAHPEDISVLLGSYDAFLEKNAESPPLSVPSWFQIDPRKVPPWTGLVRASDNEMYPISLLSEGEQREYQQAHRFRVVGASLAWRESFLRFFKKKGTVPRETLPLVERSYKQDLSGKLFERGVSDAGDVPEDLSFVAGSPFPLQEGLKAYYRGRKYGFISSKYLKSNGNQRISEFDSPFDISSKILRAWAEMDGSIPFPQPNSEPLGLKFARSVLRDLKRLTTTEKVEKVIFYLNKKKSLLAQPLLTEPDTLGWIDSLQESSYSLEKHMPSQTTPKVGLYHGVPPKREGVYPYPENTQGRVWEITAAEEDKIVAEARRHMDHPSQKVADPSVAVRASLDLALKTYSEGKFDGGLPPTIYNNLLNKLSGKKIAGKTMSDKPSKMLRKIATQLASGDLDAETASVELTLTADQIQQIEQVEQQVEAAQQEQEQQVAQQEVTAELKQEIVRLAKASPEMKNSLQNLIRIARKLG
jgi:hypothetical protein